ncbi:hypothetical protein CDAR_585641 [Caerostris darwini]|uniref:Uncharacterized protein n=1 Tax=Caerostris darwini TaxID=1538125 RepID=A0AAV4TIE1_9ARAC|nr:hypothetical protein CDAR_585641 [Caerostris darwini]
MNNFLPSNGNQHATDEWLHVVREANSSGNSSSLTSCSVDDSSQKILPPPAFHTICSRKFYSNRTEFSAEEYTEDGLNGFSCTHFHEQRKYYVTLLSESFKRKLWLMHGQRMFPLGLSVLRGPIQFKNQ